MDCTEEPSGQAARRISKCVHEDCQQHCGRDREEDGRGVAKDLLPYGGTLDAEKIRKLCHAHGVPMAVDSAALGERSPQSR